MRQRAIQSGAEIAWADAVAIAIEMAQALAHVHERPGPDGSPLGIVHRDLSPQNVMIGYAGEVKLIDFGTARGHNRRCHTVAGVVFAKPGYVAPEVARQQVGDGRIDVYALGIMLWELCAGRRFLNSDPQRHLDDAAAGKVLIPRVSEACGAPPELDDVIAKLTKNDPDERYARASLAVPELAKVLSMAPSIEGGERGVRARVALLMRTLWPHEPARSRSEFARLLRDARKTMEDPNVPAATPQAGPISAAMAKATEPGDPSILLGTPYRLVKRIGEGASGVVWEAEHVELGRRLALKVLAPEHGTSAAALDRFRTEARAVAKLSHPNLVSITDFGKSLDGRAYIAMELLVGETLDVTLKRGPMPWREAVRIASEAARALAAAHDAGLVHRDLKPQNLFLTKSGQVRLLDFGVATALTQPSEAGAKKLTDAQAHQERAMRGFAIFGTPEYMAPEQVAGDAVDGRTDIYALGCVLYEMVTGTRAFDGPSSVVVMGKQLRDTPCAPRVQAGDRSIPPALDAIVMRAMKKLPAARFPSAEAMCEALDETTAAPARRSASVRRFMSAAAITFAMFAAAAGSAQWAKTHAAALDVPLPSATAASTPTSTSAPTPTPPVALAAAPIAPSTPAAPAAPPALSSSAAAPSPVAFTVPVTALPRDTRAPSRPRSGSKSTTVVHLDHATTPAHELAHR